MRNDQMKKVAMGLAAALLLVVAIVVFAKRGRHPEVITSPGGSSYTDRSQGRGTTDGRRNTKHVNVAPQPTASSGDATTTVSNAPTSPTPTFTEEELEQIALTGIGPDGRRYGTGPGGVLVLLGPDGRPVGAGGSVAVVPSTEAGSAAANPSTTSSDGEVAGDEAADDPKDGDIQIAGLVLRGDTPVESAHLTLSSSQDGRVISATTGGDGGYQFRMRTAGTYTLALVSPKAPNSARMLSMAAGEARLNEDFVIPVAPPVRGHVENADTGEPVASATIAVWRGDSILGNLSSDSEGAFECFPLAAGDYLLKGSATGYLPGEQSFTVLPEGQSPDVRLRLTPSATITGVVFSPDGSPVPGALVSLFGVSAFNDPFSTMGIAQTDSAGRFTYAAMQGVSPETPLRAGAYAGGYLAALTGTVTLAQAVASPLEIRLAQGTSIQGIVVDQEETGIEGVSVTVKSGFPTTGIIYQRLALPFPEVESRLDGGFDMRPMEGGEITLSFAAEGFVSTDKTFSISGPQQNLGKIILESSDTPRPGRIFGVIADEKGTPLVNHNVSINTAGGGQVAYTNTDGRGGFKVDDLPEGEYSIFTNGSMLRGDVWIPMDQTYPFARPGEDKLYLIYDFAQSVKMRVVDGGDQPIRNFKVGATIRYTGTPGYGGVQESQGMTVTRSFQTSNGQVTMDTMLRGTADLTINVDSVGSIQKTGIEITPGGVIDLGDIVITSGADIEGTVVAAQGGALSGVNVRAVAPPGSPSSHPLNALAYETTTDAIGKFRLRAVPECTADLRLTRAGLQTTLVSGLAVSPPTPTQAGDITMKVGAILRGNVRKADGTPVADAIISVADQVLFGDRSGNFYGDALPEGSYDARIVDRTGIFPEQTKHVDLVAGQEVVIEVVY